MEGDFMKSSKPSFATLPKDYVGLCQVLPPRPIHSQSDFRKVTEVSDVLAGHSLSTDQEDYFDLLCRLVEDWEKPQIPKTKASGLETLQSLLESHNLTAADLSKILGVHRTLGPMILRGERKLTLKHVKTLAKHFGVSADAFID
jgi:HTH-type transcriptional regulator / antitoxin HigA